VIWPLALPGIAAGSIFTFSLTLGDYVLPDLVGGNNHDFIGNVIFRFQGVAQNVPFAAAFACVPVVIVTIYLALMKRFLALAAIVACQRADATDAGSDARPAGPDLTTALVVSVHTLSDVDGKRGDVVIELARSHSSFDWDGKASPYPGKIGERSPDPRGRRTCTCSITGLCPTCDGLHEDDLQRKHGTAKGATVNSR